MKKHLFFTVLFMLAFVFANAQKIYKVDYESQADLKVFVVNYESQADKKVYFVDYESQADLKIYFVDYESQAGWRNKSKMHLLKF